jgi:hypothetical protein
MNFRDQMNDHLNQFPDELRNSRSVRVFADSIISSYETLHSWVGPNAIRFDINWNHLVALIRGIIHIHPDNLTYYIENFRLNEGYILPEYNDADYNDADNNEEDPENNNEEDEAVRISTSEDDSEDDSDDDSDTFQEEAAVLSGGGTWACSHCRTFMGDYQTVCEHEECCDMMPH